MDSVAASPDARYPILGTFFGCCASAITPRANCTTTTRIDAANFFIAHLVWSVVYHDERGKEKCNLRLKAARFHHWGKTQSFVRLNCTTLQSNPNSLEGLNHWKQLL